MTYLALRNNTAIVRECCPVCGEPHRDANNPLAVFAYKTRRDAIERRYEGYIGAVCRNCARTHAPELEGTSDALAKLWWCGAVDYEVLKPALDALLSLQPVAVGGSRCTPGPFAFWR